MEAAGASAICTGGRQDVAPCGADVENDETLYGQAHPVKDYFLIKGKNSEFTAQSFSCAITVMRSVSDLQKRD
jgi:hypothetical protein